MLCWQCSVGIACRVTSPQRGSHQALALILDNLGPHLAADRPLGNASGQECWLWVTATTQVAAIVLHSRRGLADLSRLMGARIAGIAISDRWGA